MSSCVFGDRHSGPAVLTGELELFFTAPEGIISFASL